MTRIGRTLYLAAVVLAGCQPAADPPAAPPTNRGEADPAPAPTVDQDKAVTRERLEQVGEGIRTHWKLDLPCMFHARSTNVLGLSWRVSLLEYIGEDALYKQFKLDEPWDSPHNKPLIRKMPEVFRSPRGGAPDGHTFYRTFVGPRACFLPPSSKEGIARSFQRWPGEVPHLSIRSASISDGSANTLFFAEAGEAVPWTKPDELPFPGKSPKEDQQLPKLGGAYDDGFFAVSAAGAVVFVPKGTDEKTVRALITTREGETITDKGILEQLNAPFRNRPPQTEPMPSKGRTPTSKR